MRTLVASLLACLALAAPAFGQASDAAVKDRVAQLVEKLGADSKEDRDAAEAGLLKLGPRALSFLPEADPKDPEVKAEALRRIREALEQAQEEASLSASKITIQGEGIRLTEALKQLQSQSGNVITDLREQFGAEATNPALDLDIEGKSFFEALDILAKAAEVTPSYYTGDGTIGLMAGAPDLPNQIGVDEPEPMIAYPGPFRVELRQIASALNYSEGTHTANAQVEVAWEPRLRPMLLALKADELEIVDDQDIPVMPSVTEESSSVVLRPENPIAELNLNMNAPERGAKRLKTLKVKAEVTVPAANRTFKFDSLAKPGKVTDGDVTVTLGSTEIDGFVWKIRVTVQYPGDGPAFESYQQGLFNNRLWLQSPDGARLEHSGNHGGGFSNLAAGNGRIAFEYLFVDVPGKPADYGFVYESPGKVVTIPLEFEFHDVELP